MTKIPGMSKESRMKRKNIFGIVMGIIVVICILMAMVQFKKEQTAQSEVDASQKEDATVLPDGITINKVEDDEDYDISKNYYKDYDDTGLETYVVSGVFSDEESYIKEIREAGICEYIYKNEDGYADVKVTEEQRKRWIESAEQSIEKIQKNLEGEEMCSFEFNDDYTVLESDISKKYSVKSYTSDIFTLIYDAEIMQVFSGRDDWSVNIVIRNVNTGYELVNIQFPQEELNITPDTWDE